MAEWGLDVLGFESLEAMIHPENVASQRVVERCRFTCEGLLRSSMLKRGTNERRAAAVYGLLWSEFHGQDA